LRNVCCPQLGVIVNPLKVWGIPLLNQLEFCWPHRLALAHLLEQFGKGWPIFGCGPWHFDVVQHMAGMGLGFYLIQNFCRGAGPNARHQLEYPEP
jgi:hypothetical protein